MTKPANEKKNFKKLHKVLVDVWPVLMEEKINEGDCCCSGGQSEEQPGRRKHFLFLLLPVFASNWKDRLSLTHTFEHHSESCLFHTCFFLHNKQSLVLVVTVSHHYQLYFQGLIHYGCKSFSSDGFNLGSQVLAQYLISAKISNTERHNYFYYESLGILYFIL